MFGEKRAAPSLCWEFDLDDATYAPVERWKMEKGLLGGIP